MASPALSRCIIYRQTAIFSALARSFSSFPKTSPQVSPSFSFLRSIRPIFAASNLAISSSSTRSFATRTTTSSLNDPSPNWSNRPPKETILLDGCDFNHWLVVMEPPEGDPTRDEIIDSYIKTLSMVVGSEDEARMKIYSVSTRHYFAFGALVSEELSYKIKELPRVRWVLPDSYLDVKNKDYGGEPFIDGKAVPYDPKYHEEWLRNNARANERNRRNDRPRNYDRSRNYERRRENMQNRDFQSARPTPMSGNQGMQNSPSNLGMPDQGMHQNPASNISRMPQNNMSGQGGPMPPPPPNNYMGGPPPPPPNNYMGGPPPPPPNNTMGGPQPQYSNNYSGGPPPPPPPPPNSYMGRPQNMGGMPTNDMGGMPPNNAGGMPPNNAGGMPPNAGWSNNMPGNFQQNYQSGPNYGGMPNQGVPSNYQNYGSNRD